MSPVSEPADLRLLPLGDKTLLPGSPRCWRTPESAVDTDGKALRAAPAVSDTGGVVTAAGLSLADRCEGLSRMASEAPDAPPTCTSDQRCAEALRAARCGGIQTPAARQCTRLLWTRPRAATEREAEAAAEAATGAASGRLWLWRHVHGPPPRLAGAAILPRPWVCCRPGRTESRNGGTQRRNRPWWGGHWCGWPAHGPICPAESQAAAEGNDQPQARSSCSCGIW